MRAQAKLTGGSVGTLTIGQPAGHLRWHVRCSQCGAATIEAHTRLTSGAARCKADGCRPDASSIRAASKATLPKARRQAIADDDAERQATAKRAEAERLAIEAQFADAHQQIAQLVRQRIASQRDDEVFIDPTTIGTKMTQAQADAFNAAEAAKYAASNPQVNLSRANRETLGSYFERNGIAIVSTSTLAAAVRRLSEYGLLEPKPVPTPTVQPYVSPSFVPMEPEPAAEPEGGVGGMDGWDVLTGMPRHYTDREIDRMSSDEMKRAFKITKAAQTLNPGRR